MPKPARKASSGVEPALDRPYRAPTEEELVLGLFQRRSRELNGGLPTVPPGLRVYAIGDIHGCLRELEALLAHIEVDCTAWQGDTHVIFVGDLIDRGPDSAGVVERLRAGPIPGDRHSFLMGNHEEAMLEVWNGDTDTIQGWLTYGGRETLESYGLDRGEIFRLGSDLPRRMRELVPQSHIDFIASFDDQVRVGDYLFVHAGVRPGVPLADQDRYDLRWIRSEFLDDEESDHGAVVVHGHTICDQPQIRTNRIGIDTGCFATGCLTALVLEGAERRFLST